MSEKEDTFESSLSIDKHALDWELERQPTLYFKWSKKCATSIAEKDKAKAQLELVKGELYIDIKKHPEKYDVDKKPTENTINSLIVQQKEYIDKLNDYINATEAMNIYSGAVKGMDTKRDSLKKEVDLFLSNYYSEPHVPANVKKKVEEVDVDERRSKIKEKLKKRRGK